MTEEFVTGDGYSCVRSVFGVVRVWCVVCVVRDVARGGTCKYGSTVQESPKF